MDAAAGVLGLGAMYSPSDVKKAFHRLSLMHHPDKPGGDVTRFEQIHHAYTTLRAAAAGPPAIVKVGPATVCNGGPVRVATTVYTSGTACNGMGSRNPNDLYVCIECRGGGCRSCGGMGIMVKAGKECKFCKGARRCPEDHTVVITVPAGAPDGITISNVRLVYDQSEYRWALDGDTLMVYITLSVMDVLCGFARKIEPGRGVVSVGHAQAFDMTKPLIIDASGLRCVGPAMVRFGLAPVQDLEHLSKYRKVFLRMLS